MDLDGDHHLDIAYFGRYGDGGEVQIGHGVGDVVNARPGRVRENNIVRISLALKKDHQQTLTTFMQHIFGQAKPHRIVEVERLANFRR